MLPAASRAGRQLDRDQPTYHRSPRSIGELVSKRAIPHLRHGGTRRVLFVPAELDAWDKGAELEELKLANGSRRVRPKETT
jgi:hypothetical protein